jgi:hypothetical protein
MAGMILVANHLVGIAGGIYEIFPNVGPLEKPVERGGFSGRQ